MSTIPELHIAIERLRNSYDYVANELYKADAETEKLKNQIRKLKGENNLLSSNCADLRHCLGFVVTCAKADWKVELGLNMKEIRDTLARTEKKGE